MLYSCSFAASDHSRERHHSPPTSSANRFHHSRTSFRCHLWGKQGFSLKRVALPPFCLSFFPPKQRNGAKGKERATRRGDFSGVIGYELFKLSDIDCFSSVSIMCSVRGVDMSKQHCSRHAVLIWHTCLLCVTWSILRYLEIDVQCWLELLLLECKRL